MYMTKLTPALLAARALTSRWARDSRGVAAIEFAFVLPILVLILLGTIEIARAIDADRRFGYATASTTDLIAREQELTDADLDGMMNGIQHMMTPYDASSLSLRVMAVRAPMSSGQQPRVEWSYAYKEGKSHNKCDVYALPENLVSPGGRVIIVETKYNFSPLFIGWTKNPLASEISGGVIHWTDKATLTPRSDCVHNSSQATSSSRCDFSCS